MAVAIDLSRIVSAYSPASVIDLRLQISFVCRSSNNGKLFARGVVWKSVLTFAGGSSVSFAAVAAASLYAHARTSWHPRGAHVFGPPAFTNHKYIGRFFLTLGNQSF
ncbi:hypothetical protein SUGI_0192730 [Cryptomeria japonica]|nr:hypothetical protein SUGI_0192730 [Cryptomeria japonica]